MSALYWDDFDCTEDSRRIEHATMEHYHCQTEREACETFMRVMGKWIDLPGYGIGFGIHANGPERRNQGKEYCCIRGPGGLVRGVMIDGAMF